MITTDSNLLKWLNISAFLVMVIVNGLAGGTTIIGGKNTAQISDANPTLITPAGYTFSIWGIIYILLGVFVLYQALQTREADEFRRKIGYLFVFSCILNVVWLFLWQFEYLVFSVAVIFLLLATLIMIYQRLGVGKSTVSLREKVVFHVPFSVYLGWITIASIANVATALVSVDWTGLGLSHEAWATIALALALIVGLLVVTMRRDVVYGLVVIWALIGIATKQSTNQIILTLTTASVIIIAIALIIILILKLSHQ